eukprot:Gregarina_sp_Poly_1__906@NODE_1218_length_4748_cov_13_433027_g831_i0_p1_GENE_NODE_1218_length_4748_cov_13_433027_g831_i0NODE_1218_length_4748_cov_13_433027_g831_i0_p1_ORF_typecomplete_len497_score58_28AKAP2_C/PF15304_6/1_1e03AKAP2_C/PF15304_6/0_019_NODE_1218_length_4748_cov_13_433027_g831_i02601750
MLLAVDCSRSEKKPKNGKGIVPAVACCLGWCLESGPRHLVLSRPEHFEECPAGALRWHEETVLVDFYITNKNDVTMIPSSTVQALRRLRANERLIRELIPQIEEHLINGMESMPPLFNEKTVKDLIFIYFKNGESKRLLQECLHSISCKKPSSTKQETKRNRHFREEEFLDHFSPESQNPREDPTQLATNNNLEQTLKTPTNIHELDQLIAQYENYETCERGDYCVSTDCFHRLKGINSVNKDLLSLWYEQMQKMKAETLKLHHASQKSAHESSAVPYVSENFISDTTVEDSTRPYIYEDTVSDTVWESSESDTYENCMIDTAIVESGRSRRHKSQMALEDSREPGTQESLENLTDALQRIMDISSSNDLFDKLIAQCEKYEECEKSERRCRKGRKSSAECIHSVKPNNLRGEVILNWLTHMKRMRLFIAQLLYMCCARTPMPRDWRRRFIQLGPNRIGFWEKWSVKFQRRLHSFNRDRSWNLQELLPSWAIKKNL